MKAFRRNCIVLVLVITVTMGLIYLSANLQRKNYTNVQTDQTKSYEKYDAPQITTQDDVKVNIGVTSDGCDQKSGSQTDEKVNLKSGSSSLETTVARKDITKTILFWTQRLGFSNWSIGIGKKPFEHCKYKNCRYTSDKSEVAVADMLLFYCEEVPHFPAVRYDHQLYVHITREAPYNVYINGYDVYGDVINMTMSYRKDSNLRAPYFTIAPRDRPYGAYVPRIPFQNKTRPIAWMASHCKTESKRELYIAELQKYIDVDVFGKCGPYECDDPKSNTEYKACFELFQNKYKFYIAAENNICQDYHTEKLLNCLEHEIVAIVLGGGDYKNDYPAHSLINIEDYPNPRDLAYYLNTMTQDEYERYFRWKATYRPVHAEDSCVLCEFLHNSTYTRGERILPPFYGRNNTKWWQEQCNNDLMYELKDKGGW